MNDKYITVTQLTKYIKYKIDNDINLNQVFLKGEISNFKAHSRGHFYFTLKDENTRINAVMFSSNARNIVFTPSDGMKVLVTGKISVYEVTGGYQIYVNEMIEDGVGQLYIAYEQLKKKLSEEGLFNEEYKKPIPRIPQTIGIITAPTGAAIRDILSTIKRRWPYAKTILLPALVQGEEAKYSIVKQIENASNFDIDTLIIGRGGGSIEDLWAFNEEIVARAIFNCPIPTISAVGHEVDFTIEDFVADLRAPTPTGAAELAVPNKEDVLNYLNNLVIRGKKQIINKLDISKSNLKKITSRYIFTNPTNLYIAKEQQFDIAYEKLKNVMKILLNNAYNKLGNIKSSYIFKKPDKLLEISKNEYLNLITRLDNISPLNTLKRGYTITKKDSKVIDSSKKVKKDDQLDIEFSDGNVKVQVI